MRCQNPTCGKVNRLDAHYCAHCGTYLGTGSNQPRVANKPTDKHAVENIAAYLVKHQRSYKLEDLRQQLLRDGYPTARIAQAIQRVYGPPPEAIEHFERALNIQATEGDTQALQEKASELALAIGKSWNGYYPSAHAMLGLTLFLLGEESRARQECKFAIQQNGNHVFARCVIIGIAIEKLGVPSLLKGTGDNLFYDIFVGILGFFAARNKVLALSHLVDELIKVYPEYLGEFVNEPDDAGVWIIDSQFMLSIHDSIQSIKIFPNKSRIPRAVVNAPWEKILAINISDEARKEIGDIRRRAEGRALLAEQNK